MEFEVKNKVGQIKDVTVGVSWFNICIKPQW